MLLASLLATTLALPSQAVPGVPAAPAADSAGARPPRWGLVLSGGAARGLAQIGVIRALEEQGLRPDLVAGSSMGGLVAALYASGLSSHEMEALVRDIDWDGVMDARQELYTWRGMALPRPWIRLLGGGLHLHLPPAIKDDAAMNNLVVSVFAEGGLRCGGDFDRLPIPLRLIATDPQALLPVVIDHGDLARAVRATLGVPVFFPPLVWEGRLLIDGGTAGNLPIGMARAAGADHILAVDVAIPSPHLTEDSNVLLIALHLVDRLNKRGQLSDTLAAGDRLIWLKLPGVSAWDFTGAHRMIELGYRGSRDSVRAFARALGLPRGGGTPPRAPLVLPRVAGPVAWHDRFGNPVTRAGTARGVLGRPPGGSFRLPALRRSWDRLYRSDLFESAWPEIRVRGDSTWGSIEVRERPGQELQLAGAYDNDRDARGHATLIVRSRRGPLPVYADVQATVERLGWRTQGSLEGVSLRRGSAGWFLRGGARETRTRIYGSSGLLGTDRTTRDEALLGVQWRWPWEEVVQAGAGYGRARAPGGDRDGLLLALRADVIGRSRRHLDVAVVPGPRGYAVGTYTADVKLGLWVVDLVPAARVGLASDGTPPDELPALGGPGSFAGFHHGEWIGRRMLGLELRAERHVSGSLLTHAALQAGRIEDAYGRRDLPERLRYAGELGGELATPFGPLRADFGFPERAVWRFDLSVGQAF